MSRIKDELNQKTHQYFDLLNEQINIDTQSPNGFFGKLLEWQNDVTSAVKSYAENKNQVRNAFNFMKFSSQNDVLATGCVLKNRLEDLTSNISESLSKFIQEIHLIKKPLPDITELLFLKVPKQKFSTFNFECLVKNVHQNLKLEQRRTDEEDNEICRQLISKFDKNSKTPKNNYIPLEKINQNRKIEKSFVSTHFSIKCQKKDANVNEANLSFDFQSNKNLLGKELNKSNVRTNLAKSNSKNFHISQKQKNTLFGKENLADRVYTKKEDESKALFTQTFDYHSQVGRISSKRLLDSKTFQCDDNLMAESNFEALLNLSKVRRQKSDLSKTPQKSELEEKASLRSVFNQKKSYSSNNKTKQNLEKNSNLVNRKGNYRSVESRSEPNSFVDLPFRPKNYLKQIIKKPDGPINQLISSKSPSKVGKETQNRSMSRTNQDAVNALNMKRIALGKFSKMIKNLKSNSISSLDLSNGNLGDEHISALIEILDKATNLKHLKFSNNNLTDKSVKLLTNFLLKSQIETIDLSNNKISMIGYKYLFVISQNKNSRIRNISLKNNIFDTKNRTKFITQFQQIQVLLEI